MEPAVNEERVIVDKACLMKLFRVCSEPLCGAIVDPEDVKTIHVGAALKIHATCLNNHIQKWASSSSVLEGQKEAFTINILLAAYTLFCGLNISQVCQFSRAHIHGVASLV